MPSSLSLVVLCSGRGSNLQALIDAQTDGSLPIDIRAVVSDKSQCHALDRARRAGIATRALDVADFSNRESFDRALFDEVAQFAPQLIVCAGYMRIIDAHIVRSWHGRMINIHPSLLPKYTGLRTHQRAIDARDTLHGASVHFVTAQLDGGPLIAQATIAVRPAETASALAARLLPVEHRLLCAGIALIAHGRIALIDNQVEYAGHAITAPLVLAADGQLASA